MSLNLDFSANIGILEKYRPYSRLNTIRSVIFVVNENKEGATTLAESLQQSAQAVNVECRITTCYPLARRELEGVDLCCVIGGDGTLLGVVESALEAQVPVLGVNMGKLGFLATYSAAQVHESFPSLLEGKFQVAARTVLECRDASGKKAYALNDIVVKNYSAGLISLDLYSNVQQVNEYNCDGLVLSTPTGSTAYNLSAGGPLIHPEAKVVALTPICPHTLSNRSVIFDQDTELKVVLREHPDSVHLSIDGHAAFEEKEAFPLTITIAAATFPLVEHRKYDHFHLIRNKLRWGNDTT